MLTKAILKGSAALLLAPMFVPAAAYAQAAAPAAATAPQAEASDGVEEIVVTANRRVENQQKVPISIVAITGEALKSKGIVNVVDLPQVTPGLGFTRTLVGTNAFLRGVGTTSAGYSTEVPIATYVDGLYLPNSAASSFSFNNVERIEVLKGPQGTLYGRNSTGGLIHVITKEPGDVVAVDASASYANYNTTQLNFYGSTPLTDTLAANFAALYINQADGWGKNLFTGNDTFKFKDLGFQGKLQWKPGADTKITLRGMYDKINTTQGNAVSEFPGSIGSDGTRYLGEYRINTRFDPYARQRMYSVSLKAEQSFDFATLTSTTGYINNRSPSQQTQGPLVGQPIAGQGTINLGGFQTARTFSQELQLASNGTGPFHWIVGAFYYRDRSLIQTTVYGTCIGTVCAAPPPTVTRGIQHTKSYSGYADATYDFTDSTHLTLGLRYTSDNKTLSGQQTALGGFGNSLPVPAGTVIATPSTIDTDVTFNKLTYRAVLAQDLSSTVHAYASLNRGFKSGGFNPTTFTNPASRPEVLDAYEVGVKSDLFDRKVRLNLSGFYYNYKDIQLRSTAPPAPPGSSFLFNAASAHIKGIDADFVIAPTRGFTINGGLEILDAKYHSFPAAVCTTARPIAGAVLGGTASTTCNLSGVRLPQAPKFSFSLGATYTAETSIGTFEFNASDGYKSTFAWEPDNRLKQKGYHLLNASITYSPTDSPFSVQLFGRNLAGEYYAVSGANAGGNDGYVPGAPRTYGVKARYHF